MLQHNDRMIDELLHQVGGKSGGFTPGRSMMKRRREKDRPTDRQAGRQAGRRAETDGGKKSVREREIEFVARHLVSVRSYLSCITRPQSK